MSSGKSETAPSGLLCVQCFVESGGGTKSPAAFVHNGVTICQRHAEQTIETQTPEVNPL